MLVEHIAPGRDLASRSEIAVPLGDRALEDRVEDPLLAPEVVIDERLGDAGPRCHLLHRGPGIAPGGEALPRGVQDALSRSLTSGKARGESVAWGADDTRVLYELD